MIITFPLDNTSTYHYLTVYKNSNGGISYSNYDALGNCTESAFLTCNLWELWNRRFDDIANYNLSFGEVKIFEYEYTFYVDYWVYTANECKRYIVKKF